MIRGVAYDKLMISKDTIIIGKNLSHIKNYDYHIVYFDSHIVRLSEYQRYIKTKKCRQKASFKYYFVTLQRNTHARGNNPQPQEVLRILISNITDTK